MHSQVHIWRPHALMHRQYLCIMKQLHPGAWSNTYKLTYSFGFRPLTNDIHNKLLKLYAGSACKL